MPATDAQLHGLAGALVGRLSAIADAVKPGSPPLPVPADPETHPCRLCHRPGTLTVAILASEPETPAGLVRVLLCDPHRQRLKATIANPAKYGPTKYANRTIYALDPEVLK